MTKQTNSDRLKKIREVMGLTQRECAELFGVVHGAVGLWEAGKRKIPGPVLKLMALYESELGIEDAPVDDGTKGLKALQSSWSGRALRLASTGVYVTGQLALHGVKAALQQGQIDSPIEQQVYISVARRIVETLGDMKGLAQKLGQIVSFMNFHLPPAVRRELASLQHLSPPMHAAVIAEQIVIATGQTPRQLFAEWDEQPFAAASIGQVHQARLPSGESVAVKVQYPNMPAVLKADLKNARMLERLVAMVLRGHQPGELVQEVYERLCEECDYTHEAANLQQFATIHAGDPRIVVPQVFPDYCRATVLTTERLIGKNFSEFLASATLAERNRAGETIFTAALRPLFLHRCFNGDPHPGNYLFLDDGRVGLVDFGCVKRLRPDLFKLWMQFIRAVCGDDRASMEAALIKMKVVPDPEQFDFADFWDVMRAWYAPWYQPTPFRFTEKFVADLWHRMMLRNPNATRLHFPRELIYLNQLQWGLYAVLAALDAESAWSQIVEPWLMK